MDFTFATAASDNTTLPGTPRPMHDAIIHCVCNKESPVSIQRATFGTVELTQLAPMPVPPAMTFPTAAPGDQLTTR